MKIVVLAGKMAATLKPHGFTRKKRCMTRENAELRQGFEMQPGVSSRKGQFCVNVFWQFKVSPQPDYALDFSERLGTLQTGTDVWWPLSESGFNEALTIL